MKTVEARFLSCIPCASYANGYNILKLLTQTNFKPYGYMHNLLQNMFISLPFQTGRGGEEVFCGGSADAPVLQLCHGAPHPRPPHQGRQEGARQIVTTQCNAMLAFWKGPSFNNVHKYFLGGVGRVIEYQGGFDSLRI